MIVTDTMPAAMGRRRAFVPTMGALHDGHRQLMRVAREQVGSDGDVVVSVFVNPLQFGANEDFDAYPRTIDADIASCETEGVDILYVPSVGRVYGSQPSITVQPGKLGEELEGASRPGHFAGMLTVVAILLHQVAPEVAVFGEKDYQQLAVIRAMVLDLNMPVQIIGEPTVRAEDGLALSSRNGYLNEEQRALAPALYLHLREMADAIKAGERNYATLVTQQVAHLEAIGLRVDYLEVRHATTLLPAQTSDRDLVILVAAYLGTTRLIDNIHLNLDNTL